MVKPFTVQSVHFDNKLFNCAKARKFLTEHDYKPIKRVDKSAPNQLRYRITEPIDGANYVTKEISDGIQLILMKDKKDKLKTKKKLNEEEKTIIQSIDFDKKQFTLDKARKYLKAHNYKAIKRVYKTDDFLRYTLSEPLNNFDYHYSTKNIVGGVMHLFTKFRTKKGDPIRLSKEEDKKLKKLVVEDKKDANMNSIEFDRMKFTKEEADDLLKKYEIYPYGKGKLNLKEKIVYEIRGTGLGAPDIVEINIADGIDVLLNKPSAIDEKHRIERDHKNAVVRNKAKAKVNEAKVSKVKQKPDAKHNKRTDLICKMTELTSRTTKLLMKYDEAIETNKNDEAEKFKKEYNKNVDELDNLKLEFKNLTPTTLIKKTKPKQTKVKVKKTKVKDTYTNQSVIFDTHKFNTKQANDYLKINHYKPLWGLPNKSQIKSTTDYLVYKLQLERDGAVYKQKKVDDGVKLNLMKTKNLKKPPSSEQRSKLFMKMTLLTSIVNKLQKKYKQAIKRKEIDRANKLKAKHNKKIDKLNDIKSKLQKMTLLIKKNKLEIEYEKQIIKYEKAARKEDRKKYMKVAAKIKDIEKEIHLIEDELAKKIKR